MKSWIQGGAQQTKPGQSASLQLHLPCGRGRLRRGHGNRDPGLASHGDLIAGLLAIVATVALVNRTSWANRSVWLFNLWGAADLLFAFYQGRQIGLHPGMLGAGFYLVTALVPALLVTHVLIFGLLVRRRAASSERLDHVEAASRSRA